ncbi:hypothetical protein CK203_052315 [Vitis vinifera]|uniref:Uncharacterized protein n=1 Tax=Vitis vinifera TaxID=29760 RepID=A0A438FWF7_VITVI|nr:hypothetical protein CK203_052315 [Vitis vinifera]
MIRMLLHDTSERNIEAWELVSTNILRKYSGPIDIWLSILSSMCYPSENMHCLLNENPHKSFLAMAQHQSQWVWYVCFPTCPKLIIRSYESLKTTICPPTGHIK